MKGSRKNLHFSMENWPYLGNGERYKSPIRSGVYMPCQIKWKSLTLDDLEGQ